MTVEATAMETAPVGAVAPEVMPDSPIPKAEIPQVETQTPEPTPVNQEQTDISIYQDVLAKHEADSSYDMSFEEAEAYTSVHERIMKGDIENPGAKAKDAETPKEASTPEPKADISSEAENPLETALPEIASMSDTMAESLQKAMTKVGAKDISELPSKVDGLINQMKSTGGKLGGEKSQLQQQVDQHNTFMQAVRAKDPQAMAHLKSLTGVDISNLSATQEGKSPQVQATNSEFGDPDDYIDPDMARQLQAFKQEMDSLKKDNEALKAQEVGRDRDRQYQSATDSYVDDVVNLIADHPGDYGLNTSEVRALARVYWSKEGATMAVNPKFQRVHELITFSHENRHPDLETAHVMLQHKNGSYAQKLIDATKQGQKEATFKESPNSAISNKQGRTKGDVPSPHITDDSVTAMERGDLENIPDEWMDSSGNLMPGQVPERFHMQAFGRVVKT